MECSRKLYVGEVISVAIIIQKQKYIEISAFDRYTMDNRMRYIRYYLRIAMQIQFVAATLLNFIMSRSYHRHAIKFNSWKYYPHSMTSLIICLFFFFCIIVFHILCYFYVRCYRSPTYRFRRYTFNASDSSLLLFPWNVSIKKMQRYLFSLVM